MLGYPFFIIYELNTMKRIDSLGAIKTCRILRFYVSLWGLIDCMVHNWIGEAQISLQFRFRSVEFCNDIGGSV